MRGLTRGLFFAHTHSVGRLAAGVIVLYRRHTFAISPPLLLPLQCFASNSATPILAFSSLVKENVLTVRITLQLYIVLCMFNFWLGLAPHLFCSICISTLSFISLASLSLPICHIHKGQRTLLDTLTHTCDVKVPCQTLCSGVVA